jgi:signal transduction histidine kinase
MQRFRLAPAVEAWTDALADQVPSRIRLQLTTKGALDVNADPEQLRSVLSNLVLNAIAAIPGAGFIDVETADEPGTAVLRVSDTGRGMSPNFIRERLFRPFQTTKPHGLGIGLYQCRHIVQAWNGTMTVESQEGQGTQMVVRLPGVSNTGTMESVPPPTSGPARSTPTTEPSDLDFAADRRQT